MRLASRRSPARWSSLKSCTNVQRSSRRARSSSGRFRNARSSAESRSRSFFGVRCQSRKRPVSASGESGGRDENPPAGIGTGARGPTGSGKNASRRASVWNELRKSKSWSAAASDFSCARQGRRSGTRSASNARRRCPAEEPRGRRCARPRSGEGPARRERLRRRSRARCGRAGGAGRRTPRARARPRRPPEARRFASPIRVSPSASASGAPRDRASARGAIPGRMSRSSAA